jgi:ribosomal protein S12 methylthiotransferase accessory factor
MLPRLGITRVANITGLDRIGIPVVTAMRPTSRALAVSQGKGATLEDAKVSALMESIEMLHAERPAIALRLASANDLARERAAFVEPRNLARVGNQTLRDTQVILWASGHDLASARPALVPYACIGLDDTLENIAMPRVFPSNSNGLASGNTFDEAVVHALCESIERDAVTLWELACERDQAASAIDLSSVTDENCRALLRRYDDARVDVCAFDVTSDIGVPTYKVLIRERSVEGDGEQFSAMGSGCHLWPEIALSRALTEAAQSRLTAISGAREDLERTDYGANDRKRVETERAFAAAAREPRAFAAARHRTPDRDQTLEGDIAWIRSSLAGAGLEQIVVVDLTSSQFEIPVVRAVVPLLEGVRSEWGYVPGPRAVRSMSEGVPT